MKGNWYPCEWWQLQVLHIMRSEKHKNVHRTLVDVHSLLEISENLKVK